MTVSATPNGYADAVVFNSNVESRNDGDAELTSNVETKKEAKFLMPHEEEMTMNDFLNIVEDPASSRGIHYIQKQESQSDSLTDMGSKGVVVFHKLWLGGSFYCKILKRSYTFLFLLHFYQDVF